MYMIHIVEEETMAHLASKSSDGRNSFVRYITENPNFSKKTDFTIENKIIDEPIWSLDGKKPLTYISEGGLVNIINKRSKAMRVPYSKNTTKYAKIEVVRGAKRVQGYIRLSAIRKPTGGKRNVMLSEENAIRDLRNLIKEVGAPITILVKKTNGVGYLKAKDIIDVVDIKGTPKADFALINSRKKPVFWISHKKGGGAKSFQQYSGVSQKAGRKIYQNPEVQRFFSEVIAYIQNGKLLAPITRKIKDKNLIRYSAYGPDWGKSFGKENVQVLGQGDPILKPSKRDSLTFSLEFSDTMHTNGDLNLKGMYTPVLAATYRRGRTFYYKRRRFVGARVGIYPFAFIRSRKGVIVL